MRPYGSVAGGAGGCREHQRPNLCVVGRCGIAGGRFDCGVDPEALPAWLVIGVPKSKSTACQQSNCTLPRWHVGSPIALRLRGVAFGFPGWLGGQGRGEGLVSYLSPSITSARAWA